MAPMTAEVFAAVLASACLQAGWNLAAKNSRADKVALLAVGWFVQGVLLMPLGLWLSGGIQGRWLPYILGTGVVQGAYMCLLGWAYSLGEISVVFPVSRGVGLLGTAAVTAALGLHPISRLGMAGIAAISGGTLLIGFKELPHRERRAAYAAALLVASTVTGYTLIDMEGARAVPTVLYLAAMHLLAPLAALPYLAAAKRRELRDVWTHRKLESIAVAAGGALSYAVILWAYRHASGPYVAALRECSAAIAAILGVLLLRERFYKRKAAGIALIVAGAALLRLS